MFTKSSFMTKKAAVQYVENIKANSKPGSVLTIVTDHFPLGGCYVFTATDMLSDGIAGTVATCYLRHTTILRVNIPVI